MPTFPSYAILQEDCRNPVRVRADNVEAIAVFKDDDLQLRYRNNSIEFGSTIKFDSAAQLALYLAALLPQVACVAFDSNEREKAVIVSSKELFQRLSETETN